MLNRLALIIPVLSFTACATTGMPMDREASSTGSQVRLDFTKVDTDNATSAFPEAVDPRLPSADRMNARIHAELGDSAQAAVKLCVAPSGKVASVELERGSSMAAFDRAMLNDIRAWQFAEMPGPATVKTCGEFTISYRPL